MKEVIYIIFHRKEYDEKGNIKYEYIQLINGNIKKKEYNKKGQLKFESEYIIRKEKDFEQKKSDEGYWVKDKGDNGNLVYECEFVDGKRNGKGKEYYREGKLKFEGLFVNGLKWEGKEYDLDGNIIYELKNGNGKVKEYSGYYLKFEGEYLNGKRNGIGIELDYSKTKSYGNYNCGIRSRKFILYDENSNYLYKSEVEYIDGKISGKVKEYEDNLIFEGEYFNGKKFSGKGYIKNGDIIYEIINGKMNGKIEKYKYNDQLIFSCSYLNGKKHGKMKKYDRYSESFFIYEYKNGIINGKIQRYNKEN